ncbi:unnamed protein product [Amoebophrya sp. A120]|nr:unnamed protein product [Amoebophrya sp. A120]|eukprot:GSA120T00020910001.1
MFFAGRFLPLFLTLVLFSPGEHVIFSSALYLRREKKTEEQEQVPKISSDTIERDMNRRAYMHEPVRNMENLKPSSSASEQRRRLKYLAHEYGAGEQEHYHKFLEEVNESLNGLSTADDAEHQLLSAAKEWNDKKKQVDQKYRATNQISAMKQLFHSIAAFVSRDIVDRWTSTEPQERARQLAHAAENAQPKVDSTEQVQLDQKNMENTSPAGTREKLGEGGEGIVDKKKNTADSTSAEVAKGVDKGSLLNKVVEEAAAGKEEKGDEAAGASSSADEDAEKKEEKNEETETSKEKDRAEQAAAAALEIPL